MTLAEEPYGKWKPNEAPWSTQVLSAGAILGGVAIISLFERPARPVIGRLMVGLILVPLALLALPVVHAMFQPVSAAGGLTEYRTVEQRVDIWEAATAAIREHPFTGVGIQSLTYGDGTYTMAHNVVLQVTAETGFIGLLLFLRAATYPLATSGGRLRRTAVLVAVALLVSGAAENTLRTREYDFVAWTVLGALVAAQGPRRGRPGIQA